MIGPSRRPYPLQGQIRACALAPNDSWNERNRPTHRVGVLVPAAQCWPSFWLVACAQRGSSPLFPALPLHHTTTHAIDRDSPFLVQPSSDLSHESSLPPASRTEPTMILLPRDPEDAAARYQTTPLLNNRAPLLGLTITFVVRQPILPLASVNCWVDRSLHLTLLSA